MRKKLNRSVCTGLFLLFLSGIPGIVSSEKPPGELSRSHFEQGNRNCTICHTKPGTTDADKCLKCHWEIASRINLNRGYHRDKGEDCGVCHTEHQGRKAKLIEFDEDDFDHSETGYPLAFAHGRVKDCRICHSEEKVINRKLFQGYLFRGNGCNQCHDPPHPGIRSGCTRCHDESSWSVDNWRTK